MNAKKIIAMSFIALFVGGMAYAQEPTGKKQEPTAKKPVAKAKKGSIAKKVAAEQKKQ